MSDHDIAQTLITYFEKYTNEAKNCNDWLMKNPIPDELKKFIKVESTSKYGFLNFTYLAIDECELMSAGLLSGKRKSSVLH